MNERIKSLLEYVRSKKHHAYRQDTEFDLASELKCEKFIWCATGG